MLIFVVILLRLIFCGPCNMEPYTLYSLDEKLQCIRDTMPFDPLGAEGKTIRIISEYFESNIYADFFKDPPNSVYKEFKFDVVDDLKKINDSLSNLNNSFDFYNQIAITINKLKDCHCTFRHGCLSSFLVSLPFFFEARSNPNSSNIPYFRIVDHSTPIITAAYLNNTDNEDLRGLFVTDIDPKGGTDFQPAYKVIYDYALNNDYSGYNYHALFNNAIRSAYYMRRISNAVLPPQSTFTLRVVDENGSNSQMVNLSWYALYTGPANVTDWNDLCPLQEESQEPHVSQAHTQAQAQEKENRKGKTDKKSINRKRHHPFAASLGKKESKVEDFIADFAANAPSATEHFPEFVPFPPSGKLCVDAGLEKIVHQQGGNSNSNGNRDKSGDDNGYTINGNSNKGNNDNINNIDIDGKKKVEADRDDIVVANLSSLQVIYLKSLNIGYINLSTFSPGSDFSAVLEHTQTFANSVRQLKYTYNITDLIVDVRGNGGGYLVYVSAIMHFLFPSTLFPSDIDFDVLKTRFMDTYASDFEEGSTFFDILNTTDQPDSFYTLNVTKDFKETNGSSYTKTVTKQYVFGMKEELVPWLFFGWESEVGVTSPFSPEHVYVITNGVCYSACGLFTKSIIDSHSAVVLGVGVHPDYADMLDRYDPGSCPSIVIYSDSLDRYRDDPDLANFFDYTKFPPRFPNKKTFVGYSVTEVASINVNTRNETMYFKLNPVDDVIPMYPNYKDNQIEGCKSIAGYVHEHFISTGKCFPWQVQDQLVGCVDSVPADAHAVYGYPCNKDQTGFNSSLCVFSHCEDRYFEQTAEKCVLKPVFPIHWPDEDTPADGKNKKKWGKGAMVVTIIIVVVLVIVVIAVVAGCFFVRKKKRSRKEKGEGDVSVAYKMVKTDELVG